MAVVEKNTFSWRMISAKISDHFLFKESNVSTALSKIYKKHFRVSILLWSVQKYKTKTIRKKFLFTTEFIGKINIITILDKIFY